MTASRMAAISQQSGLTLGYKRAMADQAHVVILPHAMSAAEADVAAQQISQMSDVEYAEPDLWMSPMVEPTDTSYIYQWHYMDPARGDLGSANLPGAWDISTGAGIVVAVVDTGVLSHADLRGNLVGGSSATAGYDMLSNASAANSGMPGSNDGDGRDADPTDPGDWASATNTQCGNGAIKPSSWHGTHVAGTIAAVTNNTTGGAGVAWDSKILAVRALGTCGGYTSDIVDGIVWASGGTVAGLPANATPAKVINLSLGGYTTAGCGTAYQSAIDTAVANGATLVVAAGNSNGNVYYSTPANCKNVITIASVGRAGTRAYYSNYDSAGVYIALAAPGGDERYATADGIYSTIDGGTTTALNDDAYKYLQGTSMATPHISGIVALMLAANSNLTNGTIPSPQVPALIKKKLQVTARPFPVTGSVYDCTKAKCGAGIVDAAAAVRAVTTPPTVSAGTDRAVVPSSTVALVGTVTDDGTFTYNWTQTAGPTVTLLNASTLKPSFVAPNSNQVLTFKLTAKDDVGLSTSAFVTINVQMAPLAASSLVATTRSTTQINLAWSDNSNNENGFEVYRSANGGAPALVTSLGANVTSYADTGLTPGTTYSYYVAAFNTYGATPSNTATAITSSTPTAPTALTAKAMNPIQINLAWVDNSDIEDGFKIYRSESGGAPALVTTVGANITSYSDTGLLGGTAYTYYVLAYNINGSAQSNTASATTLPPLAAPASLTAKAFNATQINLTWLDKSTTEDGFKIYRSSGGGAAVLAGSVGANVTSFADKGLTPATAYSYYVVAHNIYGSAQSNTASATTPIGPAAPSGLTATPYSSTQIALTWTDNSNNESGFRIYRSVNGGTPLLLTSVGANVKAINIVGLLPSTSYSYYVVAYNAYGTAQSNTATATTPGPVPPTAPSGLTITPVSENKLALTWTDNSNNETGFRIYRSTGTGTPALIASLGRGITSYTNIGLIANTTYNYYVVAYNSYGSTSGSTVSGTTPPATAPIAPSSLAATVIGSTQVKLTWIDNAFNETGFRIYRSVNGAAPTLLTTVGANTVALNNTGLVGGNTYSYYVVAYNAVGTTQSNTVTATPPVPVPPAAPTSLNATAVSMTQVNLSWTDNSNNETGFRIYRSINGGTAALISTVGANVTSVVNSGLVAGTAYSYYVVAYNATGVAQSNTAAVTTPSPVVPTAPTSLTAMLSSSTQIKLIWTDASNNESGFRIYRATNGGSPVLVATVGANVKSYTNSGITLGSAYSYYVAAYNVAGAANSPTVNVSMFSGMDVQPTPTAPSYVNAKAAGSTQMDISWTDNSDNEYGFRIYRSANGEAPILLATVGANVTSYSDIGVAPNTSYRYEVVAYNTSDSVGSSAAGVTSGGTNGGSGGGSLGWLSLLLGGALVLRRKLAC